MIVSEMPYYIELKNVSDKLPIREHCVCSHAIMTVYGMTW